MGDLSVAMLTTVEFAGVKLTAAQRNHVFRLQTARTKGMKVAGWGRRALPRSRYLERFALDSSDESIASLERFVVVALGRDAAKKTGAGRATLAALGG